jgi:serine/threonine protein kinase
MDKPGIFISYAWGGESEKIVDEICAALSEGNYTIIRDKKDLGYKGNIQEFMQWIGKGKYIIIVISDKYLKSENCMYEIVEIDRNQKMYERIFPVVLNDAKINTESSRIDYLVYWDEKNSRLREQAKALENPVGKTGVYHAIDTYDAIGKAIDKITVLLKKMNTLTPERHRSDKFSDLLNAINKKYNDDYNLGPPAAELLPADFIGLKINSYIITEYINSGGFGSVYKAKHENLERVVAIKISHQITRGYRNIKDVLSVGVNGLKHLIHPNIVKVEDLFEGSFRDEKRLVIVMEYVPGGALKDLKKEGLSKEEMAQRMAIFTKICHAIFYAHTKKYKNSMGLPITGLMHGDIKPTNVLLTTAGEPKVMDFMFVDLNRLLEIETKVPDFLTLHDYGTRAIGTAGYMSPEQSVQGEVDEQTDIFALGILLFELFSPMRFHGFNFANPAEIQTTLSSFSNHLPAELVNIIFKATRPAREERYLSVQEMINAINGMCW